MSLALARRATREIHETVARVAASLAHPARLKALNLVAQSERPVEGRPA
jgi:hypothetical protein